MISIIQEKRLKLFFGPWQCVFERSPVAAMVEHHSIYNERAILSAGLEYAKPGKRAVHDASGKHQRFVDDRGDHDAIHGSKGQLLAYYDPQTVEITSETRSSTGHAPDDDLLELYGLYSRRVHIELPRKTDGAMHVAVLENYLGQNGERWDAGELQTKDELGAKLEAAAKPAPVLTIGIEVKRRAEPAPEALRRFPGRIGALYHLTPTGVHILQLDARETAEKGGGASLRPEVAMRNAVARKRDGKRKALFELADAEARELLVFASAAWLALELVISDPR
jgi:hypothetical protein